MKIIKSSAELIIENDPFKKIELAGRTCYKSEEKITDGSAKKFTAAMIKSKHLAMVEHAVFVFDITDILMYDDFYEKLMNLRCCPHVQITQTDILTKETIISDFHTQKRDDLISFKLENNKNRYRFLLSANVRAINEWVCLKPILNSLTCYYPELAYNAEIIYDYSDAIRLVNLDDYDDITEGEKDAHLYITTRFITDRGVTHEIVRHRPPSYAQESTRYVNYTKEKFRSKDGILFIEPADFENWSRAGRRWLKRGIRFAEWAYNAMIKLKFAPQQARAVLPNALKTEIVMTANRAEWKHFFNLRFYGTTGAPHPDMKLVAGKALGKFVECGFIASISE